MLVSSLASTKVPINYNTTQRHLVLLVTLDTLKTQLVGTHLLNPDPANTPLGESSTPTSTHFHQDMHYSDIHLLCRSVRHASIRTICSSIAVPQPAQTRCWLITWYCEKVAECKRTANAPASNPAL